MSVNWGGPGKRRTAVALRLAAGSRGLCLALLLALPTVLARTARAQARLTLQEALELAFPSAAEIERRTAFLSESEREAAQLLAGDEVAVDERVVTFYLAKSNDSPIGVAYFDSHRVRTLNEILMIVVTPEDRIGRIEVLKFSEPPEYRVPESWLEQLQGKELNDALSLKGSIVNMTGATLTSAAAVRASRRVLALHAVIRPFEGKDGQGR